MVTMSFDIHLRLFDEEGDYKEGEAEEYREQLVELFAESPEGRALLDEGVDLGWADMLMDYGMSYEGVTPTTMTPLDLEAVVFGIFPRKVSAPPEDAPEAIRELRAFWRFLGRELKLRNAKACLKVLDDRAEKRLAREMSNPANFGMAKSFFTAGEDRGFDLSSEEGLQQWVQAHNAELSLRDAGVSLFGPPPVAARKRQGSKRTGTSRAKRKMQRKSRKRNRKKR